MSEITIIGGHGKVALQLSRLLSTQGDTVNAVIRKREQSQDVENTGATPVVADVQELDVEAMTELFSGQDAVVWSAGAGGGDPERTYAVDRDAAIRSMDAAQAAGVTHYVMVSYMGAGQDHGVPEDNDFYPLRAVQGGRGRPPARELPQMDHPGPRGAHRRRPLGRDHAGPRRQRRRAEDGARQRGPRGRPGARRSAWHRGEVHRVLRR